MPRLGMRMILPAEYEMMTWLGRGPQETYARPQDGSLDRPIQRNSLGNSTIRMYEPQETGQIIVTYAGVALRNATGEGCW